MKRITRKLSDMTSIEERFERLRPFPRYTGIGSRETPEAIGAVITRIAKNLAFFEYVLRSGGADGSDTYFEKGASQFKEIYLPWKKFNGNDSLLYDASPEITFEASIIAKAHHPNWNNLKESVQKLHTRNVFQVLGRNLDAPSDFVICYAPEDTNRNVLGGTGQAVRIAKNHRIRVFNLFNTDDRTDVFEMLAEFNYKHAYKTVRRLNLFAWKQNETIDKVSDMVVHIPYEKLTMEQKKFILEFSNMYWAVLKPVLNFDDNT